MLDFIRDFFAESEERPNKFTLFMGEKIRSAREEAGYSQEKLAQLVYLRRATLSDIENGKNEPNTSTFTLLAYYLKKPLAYFLPEYLYHEIKGEDLTPLENELLLNFRDDIVSDYFRRLIIDIVKSIGKFDIDAFVVEQTPYTIAKLEHEEEVKKSREKRGKN